jgi:hemin uptake protein HemP
MAESLRDGRKQPDLADLKQPVRRIAVRDLMAGAREAVLLHDSEEYRLRLTSNGKLILTK